eukprot:3162919-Pyramimonas_sp.AAC.1
MVRRRFSNERLMETCFSTAPACYHKDLYKSFKACVYTGRWGSVADATRELAPLEPSLRFAWDPIKFNRGRPI